LTAVDLTGKVAAITGANSGIGIEVARALFLQGACVHLICRDRERGEKAKQQLLIDYAAKHPSNSNSSATSPSRLHLHIVNLASVSQTKSFCRAFLSSHQPLHILVNNAGGMTHKRTLTSQPEQLETNFATNVAAVFTVTEELLPALRASNTPAFVSRVITVSSGGMLTQDLRVDDLQSEQQRDGDATFIYAQNKRQQVAMTEVWQRREEESVSSPSSPCLIFHSMHPGWAETPAVLSAMPDFHRALKGKWRTPAEGADTIIWLASAERMSRWEEGKGVAGLKGGEFWLDREVQRKTLPGGWYTGVNDWKVKEELMRSVKAIVDRFEPSQEDVNKYQYLAEGREEGQQQQHLDSRQPVMSDRGSLS
jgi:dehydrogenase/reductase SDR family member 12